MRWIVRLALVVAGIAGARTLLVQQVRLVRVAGDLAHERDGLGRAESEIDALDHAIDASETRLRGLGERLDAIERAHPDGVPRADYADYRQLVDDHNAAVVEHNALVARHDALRGAYADWVARHNDLVDSANALASQSGVCARFPGWLRRWACAGGSP